MTRAERERVRASIDSRRRAELAARPGPPKPARAKKRSEELMDEIFPTRVPDPKFCQFCGGPAKTGVCRGHSDLMGAR